MRLIIPAVLAVSMLASVVSTESVAEARPRPSYRAAHFTANKVFGLGLILGSPTGLSGKYFLGADTALDFAVGFYRDNGYRDRYGDAVQAHMDFLWHPINLVATQPFYLPLYFGIGGRFLQHDRGRDFDDHTHLGVRAPIGLALDFNNVPLDIFFELALVVDLLLEDDDDHDGHIDLDGAIGIRYWF